MDYLEIIIGKRKYVFVLLSLLLFSCDEKQEEIYRIEYWITDYYKGQVAPNLRIDTIYDQDILFKERFFQIEKKILDSLLIVNDYQEFMYNDSIHVFLPKIKRVDYPNKSDTITNLMFSIRGAAIIDVTYDPIHNVTLKYYPEKGLELLLKRSYFEKGELIKTEDFHQLQERYKLYDESFFYRID